MSAENTNLQSSVRVLLSLFVMLEQDYDALVYYSDYLQEESLNREKRNLPEKHESLDFAVIDSLWFQIIIRSCSFLDEWDKFLGVRSEPEYINRLRVVKKIAASARKSINSWKELRKFRNEITAHNFRGKAHVVTIDQMGQYDCPQSLGELYFLICFIERMVRVLKHAFPAEAERTVDMAQASMMENSVEPSSARLQALNEQLIKVDNELSDKAFDLIR